MWARLLNFVLSQKKWFIVAGITIISVIITLVICNLYLRDRIYPRTWIGSVRVSRLKRDDATYWLETQSKRVKAFTFTKSGSEPRTVSVQDLGLKYEVPSSVQQVYEQQRNSILGWLRLWHKNYHDALVTVDEGKLETFLRTSFPTSTTAPIDAGLQYDPATTAFLITPEKDGYDFQLDVMEDSLRSAAAKVESSDIAVVTGTVKPTIKADQLGSIKSQADATIKRSIRIVGKVGTKVFEPAAMSGWLSVGLDTQKLPKLQTNDDELKTSIVDAAGLAGIAPIPRKVIKDIATGNETITQEGKIGQTVSNAETVTSEIKSALLENKDYSGTFAYVDVPFQTNTTTIDSRIKYTYTYSVETRGAITADLNEFMTQAAETYADARGWRGAGRAFSRVASGGDFTLVLSQASYVPLFSSACSSVYSCRVGRYVIINEDRWLNASDAWNSAGGSLRNYRHMVINHETGHWLGFGHSTCPSTGLPAPVMMQQSISLGGCVFNPWPTTSELASL